MELVSNELASDTVGGQGHWGERQFQPRHWQAGAGLFVWAKKSRDVTSESTKRSISKTVTIDIVLNQGIRMHTPSSSEVSPSCIGGLNSLQELLRKCVQSGSDQFLQVPTGSVQFSTVQTSSLWFPLVQSSSTCSI